MHSTYPLRYSDAAGELATTLTNDGRVLSVVLDGVRFEGEDFDALVPVVPPGSSVPSRFALASGALCACALDLAIPISLITGSDESGASLEVHLELGRATPRGALEHLAVRLVLVAAGGSFASRGRTGWFEDALAEIQGQLPERWRLKTCFGCGLSDYSPYGHGLFGALFCFRGNRAAYRAVRSKGELHAIWDTATEAVQETHLCPEYEPRVPGTGYRG